MAAKAVGKAMAKAKPAKEKKSSATTGGKDKEDPVKVRVSTKRARGEKQLADVKPSSIEDTVVETPVSKRRGAAAIASEGKKAAKKPAKEKKGEEGAAKEKKGEKEVAAEQPSSAENGTALKRVKVEKRGKGEPAQKSEKKSAAAKKTGRLKDVENAAKEGGALGEGSSRKGSSRGGSSRGGDNSPGGAELAAAGEAAGEAAVDILRAVPRGEEDEDDQGDGFLPLDAEMEAAIQDAATGKKSKKRKGGQASGPSASVSLPGDGDKPNVLYLARIPHGFYEDQMSGFLGQFGTITRLRLSRNKKTGKSKHFAFVEFESPEVAAIVAECMHNYLLFGSVLQCKLVPREKLHPMTWVGANRKFRTVPWKKLAKERQNKDRTAEEEQRRLKRWLRSDQQRTAKLKAAGIEYDFEGLADLIPSAPKHTKFSDDVEEVAAPKRKKTKT